MPKMRLMRVGILALGLVTMLSRAGSAESVPIRSGDRIVLIGSTFIERDVRYGYIETLMTSHFREYDLTFRNLGWSGDTVLGIARASFDSQAKGYERLIEQATAADPDLILLNYGNVESFGGKPELNNFLKDYNALLDDLDKLDARIVLISPLLQENLGPPLPDPTKHNGDVRLYTKAIGELAKKRNYPFVDMTKHLPISNDITKSPLTDNGLHFTESGFQVAAVALLKGLGFEVQKSDLAEAGELREAILEKNRLFFNQWRPQNATYITGFRKHEQGNHAAETPMYDPIIAKQEEHIAALRKTLPGDGR